MYNKYPVTSDLPAKLEKGGESGEKPLFLKAQSRKLENNAGLALPVCSLLRGVMNTSSVTPPRVPNAPTY